MRRLALFLASLASPAIAEVDIRGLVIEVARASDCMITEEIAETTFPQFGLTQDDVGTVVDEMIAAGEGEIVDNTFHLLGEPCSAGTVEVFPEADPPPVSPLMARVIAVFRDHGCTMNEEVGLPAFAAAGISEDDLASLFDETEALVEVGLMIRDEATLTITIAEPFCSGAIVASDAAEPLVRMLTENGCALTQDEAAGLVGGYGITMDQAHAMAESLVERGLAREQDQDLVLLACGD